MFIYQIFNWWMYIYIYICSIPFLGLLFWFWLLHCDKNHLRIKFNMHGKKMEKLKNMEIFNKFFIKQINSIGEIIVGFTDGLLNNDYGFKVKYLKDEITQIEEKRTNIGIQTEENIIKKIFAIKKKKDENNDTDTFVNPTETNKKKIFMIKKKT